jgi:hypothetical protein
MTDTQKLIELLGSMSEAYNESAKAYEAGADTWWDSLSYDDKLLAFYSVVKRIHDGDVKQQGSYRYVLYDVFGFGPDAYGIGMDCGYMELHNAIMSPEDAKVLANHRADKHKAVVNSVPLNDNGE